MAGPATTPSKTTATILGVLIGPGAGHLYIGQTKRGFAWAGLGFALVVGWMIASRALVARVGLATAGAGLLVAMAATTVGSVVDLVRIPVERYGPADTTKVALVGAAVLAFGLFGIPIFLRVNILEAFKIPAGSMTPTLLVGDHLFVDKTAFVDRLPKRGAVVVFRFPENPDQSFIKRVIGLPGDRIETQGGDVSINGWPIPTCALGPYGQPNSKEMLEIVVEFLGDQAFLVARSSSLAGAIQRHGGPWTVKPNEVFVLGDNRDNSHDSRMWHAGVGGGVPASLLQGQAAFIFLGAKEDATSRFGLPVHDVHLPSMAAHLRSALDGCMAKRPSVEAATPPAP